MSGKRKGATAPASPETTLTEEHHMLVVVLDVLLRDKERPERLRLMRKIREELRNTAARSRVLVSLHPTAFSAAARNAFLSAPDGWKRLEAELHLRD